MTGTPHLKAFVSEAERQLFCSSRRASKLYDKQKQRVHDRERATQEPQGNEDWPWLSRLCRLCRLCKLCIRLILLEDKLVQEDILLEELRSERAQLKS
eukprot:2608034-Pleurochrysis_carterae.AAC.3